MQGKFCLVVNKDFKGLERSNQQRSFADRNKTYVGHELFASHPYILRQRRTEHHDLLVVRSSSENFLYVSSHV